MLGVVLAPTNLPAATPDAAGGFLLIDGGAPAGQPRLTGCDRATSDLHAALDQAGAPNTVLIAPTAGALREALLRSGTAGGSTPNAVLFCGYAAEAGGNVFALGSDFSAHDDPALSAVSVRAFSRMTQGGNGLVLLDLHPMAVDGASVAAIAGALDGAAGAWSTDTSLAGTRIAATDRQPGDATLIDKAVRSEARTPAALGRVLTAPAPVVAPAALPPVPVAPAATPVVRPAPPAATTAQGSATTTPALAPKSDTATAADHAPPAGSGTIPLAPKPRDAVLAVPRKRVVHVDPAIRRVQVALLARGLFNGRVNGVDSTDTQNGIRHFQAMLGHPATGQLSADELKQLTGG